jgi:hypothetical protein
VNQKFIVIPFEQGGYAKLLFNRVGNEWVCKMNAQLMSDLQSILNGEEPKEIVEPWNGFPLGIDYGNQ